MPHVSSACHHFTTYSVVKHDTCFKHTRFDLDKPFKRMEEIFLICHTLRRVEYFIQSPFEIEGQIHFPGVASSSSFQRSQSLFLFFCILCWFHRHNHIKASVTLKRVMPPIFKTNFMHPNGTLSFLFFC